jgi:hypothetical protein
MAGIELAALFFGARRLGREMERSGLRRASVLGFLLVTLLLSFPIYLSLQRGNLESVIWLVLAAAIWQFRRGNWFVSALLLGISASVKIYPVLYFGLFLRQRRWKEIIAGLASMGLTTLVALRFMEPNISYAADRVANGVRRWPMDYAMHISPIYDHSLFQVIKIALAWLHPNNLRLLHFYLPVAAVASTLIFFFRILKLPIVNQLLFLTALSVMLPPASFDYTLQSIYIPFAWLVLIVVQQRRDPARWPSTIMVLFAIICAPFTFIQHGGASYGGFIKGLALIVLLTFSAMVPMDSLHNSAHTPSAAQPKV